MLDPKSNIHPFVKIYYLKNQPTKKSKQHVMPQPTVSFLSSLIQKQKNNSQKQDEKQQSKALKRKELNQKIQNLDLNLQTQTKIVNKNKLNIDYQEDLPNLNETNQNSFKDKTKRVQTSEQKYLDKIKQINSGRYFNKNQSVRQKYQDTKDLSPDQAKNFLSNVVGEWKDYKNNQKLNGATLQITKRKYSVQQKNQLQKNKYFLKEDFQNFLGNYPQKLKDKCKKAPQFSLEQYLKEQDLSSPQLQSLTNNRMFTNPSMFKKLSHQEEKRRSTKNTKKHEVKIHPSILGHKHFLQNFEWSSLAHNEFNLKGHQKKNFIHNKRHSLI